MAMTGAEDTTGAVIEAATEAAATREGVKDVRLGGFADSAQTATTNVRIDGQTTP